MVICGVWIIHHGVLFGLGSIRTRCVAVISWVSWCKIDRMTGRSIVWLAMGKIVVLRMCRLCLCDCTRGGVVWIRLVVGAILGHS